MEVNLIGIARYDKKDYEVAEKEMSPSEICNLLEYVKREYIPDYNYSGTEDDFENYKLHMAGMGGCDVGDCLFPEQCDGKEPREKSSQGERI